MYSMNMIRSPKRTEEGKWVFNDVEVNKLSIWASEVAQLYEDRRFNALSEEAQEFAAQTYAILKAIGFYDDLEE